MSDVINHDSCLTFFRLVRHASHLFQHDETCLTKDDESKKSTICSHTKYSRQLLYLCLLLWRIICDNAIVGHNLWICAIHGSRCAICGSILCVGIHGLRRNLWISIARSTGSAHRPAAYAASPRSPFEFVCI